MRDPSQGHVRQVVQCQFGSPEVDVSAGKPSAENRGHLQIDELGGGQVFTSEPRSGAVPVVSVICQRDDEDTGVNDEHALPEECSLPT